jgi:S-adenosylmethionine hydrolase
MEDRPLITLTTDFGSKDPFVGIMKGVIVSINPSVKIIDITHNISPQSILEAAYTLEMSYASFPHKTIHVAVVDPGVGSARRPLIVATDYHYFVGPDNGVFSHVYRMAESLTVIHVTAEHYFLPGRSATFHGRDIFAPVAAWLSKGIDIERFGDPVSDYIILQEPELIMSSNNVVEGEVVYIDRFGNLMTNIPAKKINVSGSGEPRDRSKVTVRDRDVPMKRYYSEAGDKELCSLINSFGYLELFVNGGNASSDFGINVGEKVKVVLT